MNQEKLWKAFCKDMENQKEREKMENRMKCTCGEELDFIKVKGTDCDPICGKIFLEEEWECLECGKKFLFEFEGKITKMEKFEM